MKGRVWLGSLAASAMVFVGGVNGAIAQTPTPSPGGAEAPAPQAIEELPASIDGALQEGDAVLQSDGSLYDAYVFEGKQGDSITITMESSQFDTYLGVLDPSGTVIGENDDSGPGATNSRVQITLPRDGAYMVIANGFDRSSRGNYSLEVNAGQQ